MGKKRVARWGTALSNRLGFLRLRTRLSLQRLRDRVSLLFRRLMAVLEESLLGPREATNERNLYLEALWSGLLTGISNAFLVVFAVRLEATAFQVALVTSVPAFVNMVFPIPAARFF